METPAIRQNLCLGCGDAASTAFCDDRVHVFQLGRRAGGCILAVGGELKASACFYAGVEAALTEPVGNLTEPETYRKFIALIDELSRQWHFRPDVIAHDLHPRYMSTQYAEGTGLRKIGVQHHHAHIVAVMAEWRQDQPVVGICCDGVGYGSDGAAWGCEVLYGDAADFSRAGHLEYFPLIGGDAAAVETCRPAAALLRQAFGGDWREHLTPSFQTVPARDLELFERLMTAPTRSQMTSSLGRVFDGVSFLLGLCAKNEREAQAAIALDSAAANGPAEPYPYETTADHGSFKMSTAPAVRAMVQDVKAGAAASVISARFHETIARMLAATAEMACAKHGVATVVLSGGCFANQRLRARLIERLERRRLRVLSPRLVSCGDAALALGQAVAAAARLERAGRCV